MPKISSALFAFTPFATNPNFSAACTNPNALVPFLSVPATSLIFDIGYVLEELSAGMTLKAGTILSMGTPAGVGMGFTPPRFLQEGDQVICEIEGIGRLSNRIGS